MCLKLPLYLFLSHADIHNPVPFIERGNLSQYGRTKETHFLSFRDGLILHNLWPNTLKSYDIYGQHLILVNGIHKEGSYSGLQGGQNQIYDG